jgi:hypothetical protein
MKMVKGEVKKQSYENLKEVKDFLILKVHKNKRTGQGIVMIPKKKIGILPDQIKVPMSNFLK